MADYPDAEGLPPEDRPPSIEPRIIDASDDPEAATVEVFRQGVIQAAQTIIELGTGQSDGSAAEQGVQLAAAKYVVDRVLGKIREPKVGEGDAAERLLKRINEEMARGGD